jgi:hypothetical protein
MKRILTALLLLALCLSVLASCDTLAATNAIAKADKALEETPYTVTMSMDFECEDATLNAVFDAMSLEFPVTVDGENLRLDMTTEFMGQKVGVTMTVFDKVLYSDVSVMGQSSKVKAELSDEDYQAFLQDYNTDMPVDIESFESLTLENKDGKQIITCAGITTEGLTAMNELLSETLTAMGAEAAVGDLTMTATIAEGRYESMSLTATYSVTAAGETHTVSLSMDAKYSYENIQPVTAPADAAGYTTVDYGEIAGN